MHECITNILAHFPYTAGGLYFDFFKNQFAFYCE